MAATLFCKTSLGTEAGPEPSSFSLATELVSVQSAKVLHDAFFENEFPSSNHMQK
jgi:hypothetical protein